MKGGPIPPPETQKDDGTQYPDEGYKLPTWVYWIHRVIPYEEHILSDDFVNLIRLHVEIPQRFLRPDLPVRLQVSLVVIGLYLVLLSVCPLYLRAIVNVICILFNFEANVACVVSALSLLSILQRFFFQDEDQRRKATPLISVEGIVLIGIAGVLTVPGITKILAPSNIAALIAIGLMVVVGRTINHMHHHSSDILLKYGAYTTAFVSVVVMSISIVSSGYALTPQAIWECKSFGIDEVSVACRATVRAREISEMRKKTPLIDPVALTNYVRRAIEADSKKFLDLETSAAIDDFFPKRELETYMGLVGSAMGVMGLSFLVCMVLAYSAKNLFYALRMRAYGIMANPPKEGEPVLVWNWSDLVVNYKTGLVPFLLTIVAISQGAIVYKDVGIIGIIISFLVIFSYVSAVILVGKTSAQQIAVAITLVKGKAYLSDLERTEILVDQASAMVFNMLVMIWIGFVAIASFHYAGHYWSYFLMVVIFSGLFLSTMQDWKTFVPSIMGLIAAVLLGNWVGLVVFVARLGKYYLSGRMNEELQSAVPRPHVLVAEAVDDAIF